jgi:hypothetical protein
MPKTFSVDYQVFTFAPFGYWHTFMCQYGAGGTCKALGWHTQTRRDTEGFLSALFRAVPIVQWNYRIWIRKSVVEFSNRVRDFSNHGRKRIAVHLFVADVIHRQSRFSNIYNDGISIWAASNYQKSLIDWFFRKSKTVFQIVRPNNARSRINPARHLGVKVGVVWKVWRERFDNIFTK